MAKAQSSLCVVFVLACAATSVACGLLAKDVDVPEEMKWKNPEHAQLERLLQEAMEKADENKRIVGGTPATPREYPWLTSLRKRGSSRRFYRHFCGGSLVYPNQVFTAAHCSDTSASKVEAGLGDHNLDATSEIGAEVRRIKTIVVHPRYNPNRMVFDFAMWTLTSPSTKTPVTLVNPTQNLTYSGAVATIAGWGTTSYEGNLSPVLLKAVIPIVDRTKCTDLLEMSITESMICAGYDQGGIDTCQGDSGGPIFFNVNGSPVVVGDTSFGFGCASPNSPGVYGNALVALPFIDAVSKGTKYLTIKSVRITFNPFTQKFTISSNVIDLGKNTVVKNASITVTLTSNLPTGTSTFTSSGRTSSSGNYSFTRSASGRGLYVACVTALSATGYSKVDLSENCSAMQLY